MSARFSRKRRRLSQLRLLLLLGLACRAPAFLQRPPPRRSRPSVLRAAAATANDHDKDTLPGLVSPAWLEAHLDDPDLAILDIRGEVAKGSVQPDGSQATEYRALRSEYVDGHIPGAAFVDWVNEIAETDANGVPAQLLQPVDRLHVVFGEKGVGLRKRVVVYDSGTHLFAMRCWWALRLAGHGAVAVLDGGWARWTAEDRPVTADAPCPLKINEPWECDGDDTPATSVTGVDTDRQRPFLSSRVDAGFVLHDCVEPLMKKMVAAGKEKRPNDDGGSPPAIQIIDARSPEQYAGAVSRSGGGERAGHIPFALSVPYKTLLRAPVTDPKTGLSYRRMKPPAELEATLKAAGVSVDTTDQGVTTTCVYCNGGVASTAVGFVLSQLYEMPWNNYDGSWNEWGGREDLPVEKGGGG